jgi:hypothetical protein
MTQLTDAERIYLVTLLQTICIAERGARDALPILRKLEGVDKVVKVETASAVVDVRPVVDVAPDGSIRRTIERAPPQPTDAALLVFRLVVHRVCPDCGGSLYVSARAGQINLNLDCRECRARWYLCEPMQKAERVQNGDGKG